MKTYAKHNCDSRHRTYLVFARCALRGFAWVQGEGEYASVCWCGSKTAELHKTYEAAKASNDLATRTGCGGRCSGRHEVIRLRC